MRIIKTKSMRVLFLILPLLTAQLAFAEAVKTTVTYVTSSSVYIGAGLEQGVQRGDSGEVLQKGQHVASVVVQFVSDKSASCKLSGASSTIHNGDDVVLQITPLPKPEKKEFKSDTTKEAVLPPPAAPVRKAKPSGVRLSGNVAAQMLGQTSHDALDYNYYQPGLLLRAKVENLLANGPVLNVRMNLRKDIRNISRPDVPKSEWLSRVYEVALTYDAPESRFNYSVGRLLNNRLAGIGYIDGALLGMQLADHLEVGAFGGSQPDLRTSDVNTHATKAGAYAAYQQGNYSTGLASATLAAAGEYNRGQISREFVYEQTNYARSDQFSIYQSAEININRGWRKTASVSTFELTNFLCNVRYSPVKALAVTASYDNRTPYRTIETRTIADSLFDTSLQQGYRLGLDCRLPWSVQADVQGGLRTRRSDNVSTKTLTAGLSAHRVLNQPVYLGARITTFSSRFSNGYQPTAMISRTFFNRLTAGAQVGWDIYDLKTVSQKVNSNWQRLSADWAINRRFYTSASYEFYRGDNLNGNRYYGEFGYRF